MAKTVKEKRAKAKKFKTVISVSLTEQERDLLKSGIELRFGTMGVGWNYEYQNPQNTPTALFEPNRCKLLATKTINRKKLRYFVWGFIAAMGHIEQQKSETKAVGEVREVNSIAPAPTTTQTSSDYAVKFKEEDLAQQSAPRQVDKPSKSR